MAGDPNVVPAKSCSNGGFISRADQDLLELLIGQLNGHISSSVNAAAKLYGSRIRFVDVREAFAGHEICMPETYLNGINLLDVKGSFHPNKAGQCAYAHQVWSALISY